MRLGIVRQRYTPFGGAERFVERAIDALRRARRARARLHAARGRAARRGRIEPVICNPFYIGSLWRDARFARAVRAALARDRPDLVQTHERIAGCDIFRAGDGVHRAWLAERAAHRRPRRATRASRRTRITATCSPPKRGCSPIRRSRR